MINIITKEGTKKLSIGDIESYFDYKVNADSFSGMDIEVMKRIDGAELLDKKIGTEKKYIWYYRY